MREQVVVFGQGRSLIGILTDPPEMPTSNNLHQQGKDSDLFQRNREYEYGARPAIIFLNIGTIHRVGVNRLHVKIARKLAMAGFVGLRFDFAGVGDSPAHYDNLPFEKSAINQAQEAMDFLSSARGIKQFILVGICAGADLALTIASYDSRVVGVVSLEGASIPTLRHYLKHHLFSYHSWRMAITRGKHEFRLIRDVIQTIRHTVLRSSMTQLRSLLIQKEKPSSKASFIEDLRMLTGRGVNLLLVYAKASRGFSYFMGHRDKVRSLISSGKLHVEIIEGSDHLFTLLSSQEHLLQMLQNWAREFRLDVPRPSSSCLMRSKPSL